MLYRISFALGATLFGLFLTVVFVTRIHTDIAHVVHANEQETHLGGPLVPPFDNNVVRAVGVAIGDAAQVDTNVETNIIRNYVVKEGDTLSHIATLFDISINTIMSANNINPARPSIRPGQKLTILPTIGVLHTVAKNENVASIAKRYGVKAADIISFNDIDNAVIRPGDEIIIPDVEKWQRRVRLLPSFHNYFAHPVPDARVSQRLHGNNGIDFGSSVGTSVFASADGIVSVVRSSGWNGGYGQYIVLNHNNGTQTLYAHLYRTMVYEGESVKQGEQIGLLGNTGRSTGSHLHFEVRGARNPFEECNINSACH